MHPEYGHALTPPLGEDDHIQGSTNAAIVLVEYCNYQCPHCGQAHQIVQDLQSQLGEQLCFVFRHFPLAQYPQAQRAAEAAEAANAQVLKYCCVFQSITFWMIEQTICK